MAGFTPEEIAAIAREALNKTMTEELGKRIWRGSSDYASKSGPVELLVNTGIRNRAEMQSLMGLLRAAGIDVYLISGSFKYVLETFAGPDSLGYNEPANHIFGLELEEKDGKFLPQMKKNGFRTYSIGKAESIKRAFEGRGDPLLVCGDNDNDYSMLTLPNTRLGLIINRLLKGKIDTLVQQAKVQSNTDQPRYIVQGYDQNLGIFIPAKNTIPFQE